MAYEPLGSVLVVGGCGFLGHQIVSLLANEPNCSISVLSRNPAYPRIAGVIYHACDITDIKLLRKLLLEIQPRIILNTASPISYDDKVDINLLHRVNMVGTQNLLDVAKTTESVKAFVHTSSSSVHAGSDFHFITEEAPLLERSSKSSDIYVSNAASAHIKAAKALLRTDSPGLKVDGEAFFITDDAPIPFWDFQRKIWAAAGDETPLSKVLVIPAWIGMAVATMVEFLFWIFTLGQKLPPKTLRRDVLQYAFTNRTFCIAKAKERLGYKPLIDIDEGIQRGVRWALQYQANQRVTNAGTKQ